MGLGLILTLFVLLSMRCFYNTMQAVTLIAASPLSYIFDLIDISKAKSHAAKLHDESSSSYSTDVYNLAK